MLTLIFLASVFDASVAYFCIKSERRSQSELVQTAAAKQALESLQDALLQVNAAVSSGMASPVVIGEHALELTRYADARRALDTLSTIEPASRAVTRDGLSLRDLTAQYLESARLTLDQWRGSEKVSNGGGVGLMALNVRLNAVLSEIAVERNIEADRVTRAMNRVFGWSYWVVGILLGSVILTNLVLLALFSRLVATRASERHAMNTLAMSDRELRLLSQAIDDTPNGVLISRAEDGVEIIEYANPAVTSMLGYSNGELIGMRGDRLADPDDVAGMREALEQTGRYQGLVHLRARSGATVGVQLCISAVVEGVANPMHYVIVLNDVSELLASRERLRLQASVDMLTLLPNRNGLVERLEAMLADAAESGASCAVLFVDLDHFKYINDTLGHATGDAVLREVSKRLRERLPRDVMIARYGGDEFVIAALDYDALRVEALCRNVLSAVSEPVFSGSTELQVDCSIGVALCPLHARSASDLLRCADAAMYLAKADGRNCSRVFEPSLGREIEARLGMSNKLRRALADNELYLVYQPQYSLVTHELTGLEALVRWRDGQGRLFMPGDFIPIAEQHGLIGRLGEYVLDMALAQLAAWRTQGVPLVAVSVNVAAQQFASGDFVGFVLDALRRHAIGPEWLELEITESSLVQNTIRTVSQLQTLRLHGIRIAIDDFGTGYSSLSYLDTYEIDRLKIDRSFVSELETRSSRAGIVRGVILLAKGLGYGVVAEGVETPGQLAILRESGCGYAQGYLLSKPVMPERAAELLRSPERPPHGDPILTEDTQLFRFDA
ncbi:putative bifunctional diguanylate cyclase/phosphodiesterase [Pararobbsia silviterrae]|uniref:putative bifunctional diguanylate cyclase/phosphodiesterase n=1 Tax=Pararobbsia silviterrae TaxID=1792498 RepID=UPI001314F1B4|nr:EAL domain-containing protein [Pararobbsia silviterrae]